MAVADILITPARVMYAATGSAEPDENNVGYGAAWGGNWINVGYTTAPLALNYERELFELEVEQVTLPIKGLITKETAMAETTLAELTAANLRLAFGGTVTTTAAAVGQVAMEELEAGGAITLPVYAWGFEGLYQTDAGAQYPVRVFIFRGSAVLNGGLVFSKKAAVGIPLQITAWADTTRIAGKQILKIQKVTGPAA